jgi:hypothetical protein
MKTTFLALTAAAGVSLFFASTARADDATPAPPVVVRTTVTTETTGDTDHSKFVGHFAVGYFGVSQIPIGVAGGGQASVTAPIIGVRYWKDDFLGFDVGIGLGTLSSSTTVVSGNTTVTTDNPSAFGLGIHAGVPMALASSKHFTFEVVPETNIAFASGTAKPGPNAPANTPNTSLSGFRFDLGARAGAEINFGMIGLPELAIEGSVGLYFHVLSSKASADNNSASQSSTALATSVGADPWAIFANNISALYYF